MSVVHRIAEAIKNDRFSYTQRTNTPMIDQITRATRKIDLEKLGRLVGGMLKVPNFVFDTHCISMIDGGPEGKKDPGVWPSVRAVFDAGLTDLPYDEMVIQWENATRTISGKLVTNVVMLGKRAGEKHPEEEVYHPYSVSVFRLVKNPDGDYLMIGASHMFIGFTTNAEDRGEFGFHYSCAKPSFHPSEDDDILALGKRDVRDDALIAGDAIVAAVLLLNTRGIVKQQIEAPDKLNRKRARAGNPPIAGYTQVRIGHVYSKSGKSEQFNERKPQRVHWRRGHTKLTPCGPGRTQRKLVHIAATLVNYVEGDEVPSVNVRVKW